MRLVDRNAVKAAESQVLEHVPSVRVDLNGFLLQCGDLRHEIQSSLALFLLQFQRNTPNRSLGNSAHQVRCVSSNLVAHALGWQNGNIVDDTLVGVEVNGEASVVFLDNGASTLLYGLGTNSLL